MIKTETYTKDGVELVRTWSDANVLIHGGFPEGDYEEAIDPVAMGRTYVETGIPISEEADIDKSEAYDIIFEEDGE